jgi:hypothetical protein
MSGCVSNNHNHTATTVAEYLEMMDLPHPLSKQKEGCGWTKDIPKLTGFELCPSSNILSVPVFLHFGPLP